MGRIREGEGEGGGEREKVYAVLTNRILINDILGLGFRSGGHGGRDPGGGE